MAAEVYEGLYTAAKLEQADGNSWVWYNYGVPKRATCNYCYDSFRPANASVWLRGSNTTLHTSCFTAITSSVHKLIPRAKMYAAMRALQLVCILPRELCWHIAHFISLTKLTRLELMMYAAHFWCHKC